MKVNTIEDVRTFFKNINASHYSLHTKCYCKIFAIAKLFQITDYDEDDDIQPIEIEGEIIVNSNEAVPYWPHIDDEVDFLITHEQYEKMFDRLGDTN